MKIAIFHALPIGGARRAVNEIAILLKKKHLVDLYLIDEQRNNDEKKYFNNVFLYPFSPKKWSGNDWRIRIYKDTIELVKLYFLEKKIAKDIENKGYEMAFVNASRFIEAPFILQSLNIKKIFYCHDPYYRLIYEPEFTFPKNLNAIEFLYEKINRFLRKILDRANFKKSDLVLVNSYFTKNKVMEIYGKESVVAYLGVDQNFFKPDTKITKDIDILYIGSRELIDGYNFLKDVIRRMITKPKIKTVFAEDGWITNDKEILDLYQRSKVVVSFSRNEPFGLVPLEAMACGSVVIAVSEGGYKETIIDGETGFLVNLDPDAVARKLNYLLDDNRLRDKIGSNARLVILKNWTWEKSVERFLKVIKYEK